MQQLSFFEKLSILFQNIIAHPIFICILLLPIPLIFFNKKITKKTIIILYIIILAIVLFVGNTVLFELFDNVIDGIFMTLYFPNFVTLFFVELLSAIITLITFIKKKISKVDKIINITSFVIIQMLFCLILTVIKVNDINIYEENALYASDDALTLMQLLMGTFAIQIISLIVIWTINKVTEKLDGTKPEEVKHENKITHVEPNIKMPKIKPLNKTYIEKFHLEPVDLKEEIKKEENKKPDLFKPMEPEKIPQYPKPKKQTVSEKIINTKKETPIIKPPIEKIPTPNKVITPVVSVLKPKPITDPKIKKKIEQNKKKKSDELITNLVIINFDKMVSCIKNLKTVYTL